MEADKFSGSAGNLSIVGNFDENGLNVNNWNGNRNDNIGCGASRQSSLIQQTPAFTRAFVSPLLARLYPPAEHAADFVNIRLECKVTSVVHRLDVLHEPDKDAQ